MTAQAEQFWSDNSLSLLYGGNYKMIPFGEDSEARTMTLEHASGHSWGGVFLFVDRIQTVDDSYRETYGELSPSFFLKKFEGGFIKSVNAEFTYELGSSTSMHQDNYLAGVGVDFNIPGMDFFKATVYHAWDNYNLNGTEGRSEDDQLTLSYGWHKGQFNIDGFLDFTPSKGSNHKQTELNFTPQITYDFGPMLGLKNKVKVGVEYAYWKNKFGNDDTQNNFSLLLKWHL